MKTFLLIVLALVAQSAISAPDTVDEARLQAAEERLQEAARELAELSMQLHGGGETESVFRFMTGPRQGRAMLGINAGSVRRGDAAVSPPAPGVEVLGVSPGGPADKAGIVAGDVIVALDGQRLDDGASPPGPRLLRIMDDVEPGATVRVAYLRDGVERTVDVETVPFEQRAFVGEHLPPLGDGKWLEGELPLPPPFAGVWDHHGWRGLELVPVGPDLGRYFGTDEGLLVVRMRDDEELPFEPGDVILRIGGATPDNVPDAMRLLRFYKPGDTIVFEIMREQRGRRLEVIVPARDG